MIQREIQPPSPQYQIMNVANRNNRNCTAMVQPKNNVATNNTLHLSQVSQHSTGPNQSQSSRNKLPEQQINNPTSSAQYNSLQQNTSSMSQNAKMYKSTEQQNPITSYSNNNEAAQQASLQMVRQSEQMGGHLKGAQRAHDAEIMRHPSQGGGASRGAHSAQMDLSIGSHRNELLLKNFNQSKLHGTSGISENLVGDHHTSQKSLGSHRSNNKRSANQPQTYVVGRGQHNGTAQAVSPAHRSAATSKEPFFPQAGYSSHSRRAQENGGVGGGQRAIGTGSSEKYGQKPNGNVGSVHHQIIVNGFQNKNNSNMMGGRGAQTGTLNGSRVAMNVGRPKSNSGSSNAKMSATQEHISLMKGKNSTPGLINAVIGHQIGSGQSSSAMDQHRGSKQRTKQNQSTVGKLQTYTTDKKGKTVRHDIGGSGNATPAHQSAGANSHGLNSMRNYSGSLQKAPMASSSIYKSQRGQYQYSKVSSRGNKPTNQESMLQNARTAKALAVSGTVGSESTGLSRSGRSGEADRTGAFPTGGAHSSISSSGIPLHPKLMAHKQTANHNTSGRLLIPNQKNQGGSLTQNQTPNPLSYSNSQSTIQKQRQFYNSNQNTHDDVIKHRDSIVQKYELGDRGVDSSHLGAENGSTFEKIGSSSEHDTSQRSRQMNQKIQRFDFRDYDSDEKLRIKNCEQPNNQSELTKFKMDDQGTQLRLASQDQEQRPGQGVNLSANNNMGEQSYGQIRGDNEGDITTSSAFHHLRANIEHGMTRQVEIHAGDRTHGSVQQPGSSSNLNESTQKDSNHNISDIVPSSQKLLSQSKSTGKVTRTERVAELAQGGSHTSPHDDVHQIDDGKLRQYQQLLQNVKFQTDEIRAIQGQSENSRTNNGSESLTAQHYSQMEAARTYDQAGSKGPFKSLEIEIPESSENQDYSQREQQSQRAQPQSSRLDKNEDAQTSHSLLHGEENLLPSTEKKDAHSKISAQRIPKSSGTGALMKTSTNLISNMKQNKNIFLGKLPCNSTRNNNRYGHQILDEEFPIFSKDKSLGRQRQGKGNGLTGAPSSDAPPDPNQETPRIVYKDRSSITNRILQDKVSFEKRTSPEKGSSKAKGKKSSSSKKEPGSSAKKQQSHARSALMHRGTSQGPPVNKNRENRIAAEVIVPSASSTSKNSSQIKGSSVPRMNGASTAKQSTQAAPASTLSKCIGIRSGSESNVKTNSSNILNAVASGNQGLTNMESINMHDQRGLGIQPAHKIIIPNDDPTKTSNKRTGIVRAYAANTNQGLVRTYNEDRVSIITNLLPPKSRTDITADKWPRCSYFGIYDGHGGSLCADFLRDNLHQFVIMEQCFPANPKEAIVRGFEKAEKAFMDKIYNPETRELKDKSGSCAIVVLIVQEICYVANVGDSRAVLSCEGGQKVYPLSLDHKPGEDCETERIRAAGGQIYYRTTKGEVMQYDENKIDKQQQMSLAGPLRVLPGRLSVARTFGDPEAKIPELGGNPHVVIHNPDVKSFQIKKDHDFIALGCDGIFDKMSNGDAVMCVWKAAHDNKYHQNVKGQAQDVHKLCGMGVEYILKNSLLRRSLDNVTVVVIGFSNLKHQVFGHQPAALQFKSDGDSGNENALKTQSQVYPASQQLAAKKQNIVNSHRERDSKASSKGPEKQDSSGKTLERNRSANLPRDSVARQSISMKYQQITQSNKKQLENASKASRKHSTTGHNSASVTQERSDKSQKKRALTSTSAGAMKDKKQSPSASTEAPNSIQIKKQYNLHQNISMGHLHKPNSSYTARPSQAGSQKEGAKPPLSHNIKYNNYSNQISSQNTTPTNSMGQKVSSSQIIGHAIPQSQRNNLKAPRYSGSSQNYFSVKQNTLSSGAETHHTEKQMSQTVKHLNFNV